MTTQLTPTTEKQRFMILDALRGFALFTIILANLPEFGLWTFLPAEAQQAMPSAKVDGWVRFFQYFLIDGKGYGLFSLLFGCGFSIIISHALQQGSSGIRLFYRRMSLLLVIALAHLLLIWSGDILCLYAVLGMVLPLFHRLSNHQLLGWSVGLLALPVLMELVQQVGNFDIAAPLEAAWWAKAHSYGINEDNFARWLVEADNYAAISQFLMQGAVERMWEFVDGDRLPKVLGLFVLGYCMGRNGLYAAVDKYHDLLKRYACWLGLWSMPLSLLYAWESISGHPWGATMHALIYFLSVVPMTLFYLSLFCLLWLRHGNGLIFRLLAKPGRMALTNYIGQSVLGIAVFYGIGMGMGLKMGLAEIEITAVLLFAVQVAFSAYWMHVFRFGPIEWVWRMLTYGRWLNPLKVRT